MSSSAILVMWAARQPVAQRNENELIAVNMEIEKTVADTFLCRRSSVLTLFSCSVRLLLMGVRVVHMLVAVQYVGGVATSG